jgi:hypothetical protein
MSPGRGADCAAAAEAINRGLAASGNWKPSVVQIRSQDVLPNGIRMQVVAALLRMTVELEVDALVIGDPLRTRARVSPFCPKG